jgi:hypothetical protein
VLSPQLASPHSQPKHISAGTRGELRREPPAPTLPPRAVRGWLQSHSAPTDSLRPAPQRRFYGANTTSIATSRKYRRRPRGRVLGQPPPEPSGFWRASLLPAHFAGWPNRSFRGQLRQRNARIVSVRSHRGDDVARIDFFGVSILVTHRVDRRIRRALSADIGCGAVVVDSDLGADLDNCSLLDEARVAQQLALHR